MRARHPKEKLTIITFDIRGPAPLLEAITIPAAADSQRDSAPFCVAIRVSGAICHTKRSVGDHLLSL
jgi:hypothetical protein